MRIDYSLNILKESNIHQPRPEIIDPIINSKHRIFEINAANGYGKTFLLNLIAFSLKAYNLGDDKILNSLKNSVKRYLDNEYYDLEYNLEFDLPDGKILNSIRKKGKDVIKYKDEAPFDDNDLHNDIAIVYDVPIDPSKRLNAVIKDVGKWNDDLYQKIHSYFSILSGIERDFGDAKDLNKINAYEEELKAIDKDIISAKEEELYKINIISELNLLLELDRLKMKMARQEVLENEKVIKEKKFKKLSKPELTSKKNETRIKELQNVINSNVKEFDQSVQILNDLIEDNDELNDLIRYNVTDSSNLDKINSADLRKIINSENYFRFISEIEEGVESISDEILRFIDKQTNSDKYLIYNFLKDFLDRLNELDENDAGKVLVDIMDKDIGDIRSQIEEKMPAYKIRNYRDEKLILRNLPKTVKKNFGDAFRSNSQLIIEIEKKGIGSDTKGYYELKNIIDDKKKDIIIIKKEINRLKVLCSEKFSIKEFHLENLSKVLQLIELKSSSKNIKKYRGKVSASIHELKQDFESSNNWTQKLERRKRSLENALNIENDKVEESFTEEEKEKINRFSKNLRMISTNLIHYKNSIENIKNENYDKIVDEEDKNFLKIAGGIIAFSMHNKILRPDGEYINFGYYDMIKQEFHCEDEIIIKKEDISTGLASANYLRQKIENIQGKYVIVLLDEISDMAGPTFDEVISSIRKIEGQKRLVLALLVKPIPKGIAINQY